MPALGQPGAVVNQPQRAQRFNQSQLAAIKLTKLFIAIDQRAKLLQALWAVTSQQHPQVLHGRAGACVVQVDKVWAGTGQALGCPQNIARVAVAVQANVFDVAHAFKHGGGGLHGFFKRFEPA